MFSTLQQVVCGSGNELFPGWRNQSDISHVAECSRHFELATIPCLFLLIFCPILLNSFRHSRNSPLHTSSPIHTRIVLNSLLLMDLIVMAVYDFHLFPIGSSKFDAARFYGDLIQLGGSSLALFLTIKCKTKGIITSGTLTIYWLLVSICGIPELHDYCDGYFNKTFASDTTRFMLFVPAFVIGVLEFILCCFADKSSDWDEMSNTSPEHTSSFLNRITFQWVHKLLSLGKKKTLTMEDLWDLNEENKAEKLMPPFMANFEPALEEYRKRINENPEEARNAKSCPSLFIALLKTFKWKLLKCGFCKLMSILILFIGPQLLKRFLGFFMDKTQSAWYGLSLVFFMALSSYLKSVFNAQYVLRCVGLGLNTQTILKVAVYSKTLKLTNEAKKQKTTGEIENLMGTDVGKIQSLIMDIMDFWTTPVHIIIAIVFLCYLFTVSAIAGIVVLVAIVGSNVFISLKSKKYTEEMTNVKDERMRMMSEVLNGMKILKLYSWESSMERIILAIREKELQILKVQSYFGTASLTSWNVAPLMISVSTFVMYNLVDPANHVFTAELISVAISLFALLQLPMNTMGHLYKTYIEFGASNDRLKEFFAADEMAPYASVSSGETDTSVSIENGYFSWSSDANNTLKDITLKIKKGQLVAIVGRVGSGKSSLLHALLGEMHRESGHVEINGSISYVSQQAWIQNMSLRDNILFESPFDQDHYIEVIRNCALKEDLMNLPAGDRTEIGEKGINLSGGQKQRVSLARAVYQNSDIFVLDDPLSAVDSHVGKHIFENVISSSTGCLRTKTRILVTHGLTYLRNCDQIILLKDGQIEEMGSFQQLLAKNGMFADLMEEFSKEELIHRLENKNAGEESENQSRQEISPLSPEFERIEESDNWLETSNENQPLLDRSENEDAAPIQDPLTGQLIDEETVEEGKVDWKVYIAYFRAIGIPTSIMFLVAYAFSVYLGIQSNMILAKMSENTSLNSSIYANGTSTEIIWKLGSYAGFGLAQSLVVCIATVIMQLRIVRASRILHEGMLKNIMSSPMAFFDVTPIGRILNRFVKDIETVDGSLPGSVCYLVMSFFQLLTTVVLILWATTPWNIVPFAGIGLIYGFILNYYIKSSRQLKRLISASASPISSHFQESIQGASSIRAYGAVDRFIKQSQQRIDVNTNAAFHSQFVGRWLAVRLEMISNFIILSTAITAIVLRHSGVSPALVGLSISYAMNITLTLLWVVWTASGVENDIVSVERIKEYTNTPTEGNDSRRMAPDSWPDRGQISFKNFSLKYREGLDRVLYGISVDILPSEKIGIVGRTGAGKSSLTLALFRIIEADGGSIEIDGINIADLKLEQLRSRLTIVPQDPVLFSGTMRMNLDPFEAHGDDQVWKALENAHLGLFVRSLPKGLNHHISEGGENLSVGQRQLICLARALLRKTKVLVLDEAAAAVDVETDSLIQRTIREQFKDCTVLTIAHRLNTVMDSDQILVLDKGRVGEFDAPKKLLANSDGIFYSMAKDANLV